MMPFPEYETEDDHFLRSDVVPDEPEEFTLREAKAHKAQGYPNCGGTEIDDEALARFDVVPDVIDLTKERSRARSSHDATTYDDNPIPIDYSYEHRAPSSTTHYWQAYTPDQSPHSISTGNDSANSAYTHGPNYYANSKGGHWHGTHRMSTHPATEGREEQQPYARGFSENSFNQGHYAHWHQQNNYMPYAETESRDDAYYYPSAQHAHPYHGACEQERRPVYEAETEHRDESPDHHTEYPAPSAPYVQEYLDADILCGRGALMIWHPGNQFFRQLVQQHRQRYFFSRRQEKKNIAGQILNEIKARGGRFLRRSQATDGLNQINVWVEIDEERAYQKTCQALREGAPEIRKKWRGEPSTRRAKVEAKEDDAASK